MDGYVIDLIARKMNAVLLRRELFAIVANAAVARHTGAARSAQAGCTKVGGRCKKDKDCCGGARCKGKKCQCKSGWGNCRGNGRCQKLASDDANCGACGNACPGGESCQGGDCQTCIPNTPAFESPAETCSSDAQCCSAGRCCTFAEPSGANTGCFDLLSNTSACGLSCDTAVNCLNTNQICVNGACVDPE